MKKFATVAAVAILGAIVLPSCKKDYNCTCTFTAGGVSQSVTTKLENVTKKDAKAACETNMNMYSNYTGVTCNLD